MSSRYFAEIDPELTNNTHASLVHMVGEGKRVLELGAASGYMTRSLKERGCQVVAVEYDPAAVEELASVADDAVIGDLNDPGVLDKISGPFDVVLAGDVLEHLMDPLAVLKAVTAKLGPDGEVIISIPNVAHVDLRLSLLQGRFDYQATGLLDDTHIRFFTRATFLDLLHRAGLVAVEVERTIVRAFESELAVARDSVGDEVLAEAMSVPESETYQFIVRAVPDRQDGAGRRAAECAQTLREFDEHSVSEWFTGDSGPASRHRELELLQSYLATAEADRDQARELHQQAERDRDADRRRISQLELALNDVTAESDGLRAEVAVTRRELLAACISESKYNAVVTELDAVTEELVVRGPGGSASADGRSLSEVARSLRQAVVQAEADQRELALIRGARSHRMVARYRQVATLVAPPGTLRQSVFLVLSGNRNRG